MHHITEALSAEVLITFAPYLLGALALLLGTGVVRRRRVALAAYHAFHIVEDLNAECRSSGKAFPFLDKASAGLKFADEWMLAHGWRPLKPGEQERAQLAFKALHGETKASTPPPAPGLLMAVLLLPLASFMSGCAALHQHPRPAGPGQCEAWKAAELAWATVDAYVRQTLVQERAQACALPPTPELPPAP